MNRQANLVTRDVKFSCESKKAGSMAFEIAFDDAAALALLAMRHEAVEVQLPEHDGVKVQVKRWKASFGGETERLEVQLRSPMSEAAYRVLSRFQKTKLEGKPKATAPAAKLAIRVVPLQMSSPEALELAKAERDGGKKRRRRSKAEVKAETEIREKLPGMEE